MFPALHQYALNKPTLSGSDRSRTLAVIGFDATDRITAEQRLAVEFVAEFMQTEERADPTPATFRFAVAPR